MSEDMVHSGASASIPGEGLSAACRNCSGEGWVCENHEDQPWGGGDGCCRSGAGAPCPVCSREMACAPYAYKLPDWRPIGNWNLERDGDEVLICGGLFMDETTTFREWYGAGDEVCIATRMVGGHFSDNGKISHWRGRNAGSHDEFYWHLPTHFMPLPKAKADIR